MPGCYSIGDGFDELKNNLREAISLHIQGMLYDGEKVADDIIAGNYDFDLRISVKYLFKNYPITIKGVAKCTGINRTLLNHYAKSDKTMSERQAFRITKTINDIGDDLRRLHL